MDILEKAMQAFSKVHCTHLTLYHKATLTNDPNKAKSIVELSQLPSDFCSLLTAEFGLNNCQKKKRKTIIETCADNWPWNNLTSTLLSFYLCFICPGKRVRVALRYAPTLTQKPCVPVLQAASWPPGSAEWTRGPTWRGVFPIWRPLTQSRWDQHGMRKLI